MTRLHSSLLWFAFATISFAQTRDTAAVFGRDVLSIAGPQRHAILPQLDQRQGLPTADRGALGGDLVVVGGVDLDVLTAICTQTDRAR